MRSTRRVRKSQRTESLEDRVLLSVNPISQWDFNSGSGSTATDSVGTNNGTLVNGPVWATGTIDGTLEFDGVNDYVEVPHSSSLVFTDKLTVEAWVRLDDVDNNYESMIWKTNNTITPNRDFALRRNRLGDGSQSWAGRLNFTLNTDAGFSEVESDFIPAEDRWYHVIGVYDGSTQKLYVDGQENNSVTHSGLITNGSQPLYIGREWVISSGFKSLQGGLDRVAVYDQALTAQEVLDRYTTTNRTPTAEAGGEYRVAAGAAVNLDASGSTDPNNNITTYEWDFDYDGSTFDVDATGSAPSFDASGETTGSTRTIALRVTDAAGSTDIDTGLVVIEGIVSQWDFNEGTGTTATDSANSHDGTLLNGPAWIAGAIDGALQLDGINDHIEVPHAPDLEFTEELTVEAWVRFDTIDNNYDPVMWKPNSATQYNRDFALIRNRTGDGTQAWHGKLNFGVNTTSGLSEVVSDFVPEADRWYHVVGVYDGATNKLYIDGQENNSIPHTGTLTSSSQPLSIGDFFGTSANSRTLDGSLERVATFNTALSAAEVLARYDINDAPTADSGGPYAVDEGGTTTLDGSGSADPQNNIVSYEWDFDYDGVSFDVDATGIAPVFSAELLDGPVQATVALRVTDGLGLTGTATSTLTVSNVSPSIFDAGDVTIELGDALSLPAPATNLVANGSFETPVIATGTFVSRIGSIPGWTAVSNVDLVAYRAPDGRQAVDLIGHTVASGHVRQNVTTVAGQQYVLTFNLRSPGDTGTITDAASVSWNGSQLDVLDALPVADAEYSYLVTASGTTSEVRFDGLNYTGNWSGPLLDHVRLTPLDEFTYFTEPAFLDTNAITIDWGDGSNIVSGDITVIQAAAPKVGLIHGEHVYSAAGTFTVTLTATDDDTGSASTSFTVTVQNSAPTAVSGGPYSVAAGESVTLDGSGSTDPNNNIDTYEWDFAFDGSTFNVDATGVAPVFDAAALVDAEVKTIALRVTDTEGLSHVNTATLSVLGDVAEWKFTEGSGTIAFDSVGNHDGTLINGPTWTSGAVDGGLTFDGSNDYVTIPDADLLDPGSELTMETLVRFDTVGNTYDVILAKGSTSVTTSYRTYSLQRNRTADGTQDWHGKFNSALETSTGRSVVQSDFVPNPGQWYYVVTTFDGQDHRLYIDGVLNSQAAHSGTINSSAEPLFIGRAHWPGNENYLDGDLEYAAISNRAISGAEVLSRYQELNQAPTAEAGGPYAVVVDGSVALDGSGSTDPEQNITAYEWDLDYDGSTFGVDATGTQPVFDATGLPPGTRTVALRVTDGLGLSHIDTASLEVTPAGPVIVEPIDRGTLIVGGPGSSDVVRIVVSLSEAANAAVEADFDAYQSHLDAGNADTEFHLQTLDIRLRGFESLERLLEVGTFRGVYENPIVGTNGSQALTGSADADLIIGNGGHDTLTGGGGNDILVGGTGNDIHDGGDGDDTYLFSANNNGYDTFTVGSGHDRALATDPGTVIGINGYANGVDEISGPGDTIVRDVNGTRLLDFSNTTLTGVAEIDAGGGHDTITASNLSAGSYRGGSGNDNLTAGTTDTTWLFDGTSNGFDSFTNGSGTTTAVAQGAGTVIGINGYANGVDEISGPGDTIVRDVNGTRLLDFSNTTLTGVAEIDAGGGHDTITASNLSAGSYRGGSGNDNLTAGTADTTWLFAGTSNGFDSFTNGSGTTTAIAQVAGTVIGINGYTNGVDEITGPGDTIVRDVNGTRSLDFSNTTLTGVAEIDAGGGHDIITASNLSAGSYRGGSGNDTLTAGTADTIWLFAGTSNGFDSFTNGSGTTTAVAQAAGTVIGVNGFANGVDEITGPGDTIVRDVNGTRLLDFGNTTLTGVAEIDAGGGHDTITASNLSAGSYRGGSGNDDLTAGTADTTWLFDGTSNGFDSFTNGSGTTTAVAQAAGTVIGINGFANGVDEITGPGDTIVRDVNGTRSLDFSNTTLTGVAEIDAGGGHDTITASNLSDNVVYTGGSGNDVLLGGSRSDRLSGGTGTNTLTGGAASDVFLVAAGGMDTVTDFREAHGDILDVSATGLADFNQLLSQTVRQTVDADSDGFVDDTLIDFGAGGQLNLIDVLFADLESDDFLF